MTKDYLTMPPTAMRRSDRAQNEDWIRAFLHSAPVGILATAHDNQPYLHTNLFVYDQAAHCLYFHTALVGRTIANIEHNPKICFTVMEMGRLLPADEALEYSVEYASVIVFGTAQVVEETGEALRILQRIMDKYAPQAKPGTDYRPPGEVDLKRTGVFRIDIDDWSGKKKEAAADFPGAYAFIYPPVLESNKKDDEI